MQNLKQTKHLSALILVCFFWLTQIAIAQDQGGVTKALSSIRSQWAVANYELQDKKQEKAYIELLSLIEDITKRYPDAADAWIWSGIIKSSYAGVKGGLGALKLVKQSRRDLEKAISIDADAMQGSAYTSLGTLYFKVPGWPISFGSNKKAEKLLKQALQISPNGIDSNYFYALFLEKRGKHEEAKAYLQKAQQAPPRLAYPLEDKGRQQAVNTLLAEIDKKLNNGKKDHKKS